MTINRQANSVMRIQMIRASDEHVGGSPGANISDVPRGFTTTGLKYLALVDNISGSCGGGWMKLVYLRRLLGKVGRSLGVLWQTCSIPEGARVYTTSIVDIWSGLAFVDIDCSAGAESCYGSNSLLTQDQCMLKIFGQGPYRFGIFGSVLMSVQGVNATNRSTG